MYPLEIKRNRRKNETKTFLLATDNSLLHEIQEVRELLNEFQKDYPEVVKKALFYRIDELTRKIVINEKKNA